MFILVSSIVAWVAMIVLVFVLKREDKVAAGIVVALMPLQLIAIILDNCNGNGHSGLFNFCIILAYHAKACQPHLWPFLRIPPFYLLFIKKQKGHHTISFLDNLCAFY